MRKHVRSHNPGVNLKRYIKHKMAFCTVTVLALAFASVSNAQTASVEEALEAVVSVKLNGVGNEAAVKAMKTLNAASSSDIPKMLQALSKSNQISANWIRAAVTSIVAREKQVPRAELESYLKEESNSAVGRLLAFDLLTEGKQELAGKMIPTFIDDPSLPLRYKAVAALVSEADEAAESDPAKAIGNLGLAFNKARDIGQVQAIAGKLADLGVNVDLQKQLGFLNTWQVVGAFDNKDQKGFDVAFGPEEAIGMIDLAAVYKDLKGEETKWQTISTADSKGIVDLNDRIGKIKGASIYALSEFKAEEETEAEFRIGTPNATKIWLNGELVMVNEIYHNSNAMDKFSGKVKLKKGANQILIKVCQNEQEEPWAQDWQFQLRICDASGKAIPPAKPPRQQY